MTEAKRIVIASARQAALEDFTRTLATETGAAVHRVDAAARVPDLVREASPALVVVDGVENGRGLDKTPREVVMDVLAVDAMVHTAVLSPLPGDEFHETYEGLGVLMGLPLEPTREDARKLARALADIFAPPA